MYVLYLNEYYEGNITNLCCGLFYMFYLLSYYLLRK